MFSRVSATGLEDSQHGSFLLIFLVQFTDVSLNSVLGQGLQLTR